MAIFGDPRRRCKLNGGDTELILPAHLESISRASIRRRARKLEIKKDQPLVLLSGKESDYEVVAYAQALCDFDSNAQTGEFKKLLDPDIDASYAQQRMFLIWATKKHLIELTEKSPGAQWWLGAYGELHDSP